MRNLSKIRLSTLSSVWVLTTMSAMCANTALAQQASGSLRDGADAVEEIRVLGRKVNLVGQASTASEGIVTQDELAIRPLLRTGEVLETVPGLVASQHSGPGKANQYYLRGFNLDHGNDFATLIDAMPVNMRTHGHGQGYTDLNFIIPELIGQIDYQKGSYYPATGDFSGTGTARLSVADSLRDNTVQLGSDGGQENWNRLLATGQSATGTSSSLMVGLEAETTDGYWDDVNTDLKRKNLWLKQQWQHGNNDFSVIFMGYHNSWNSADQIPQRAVEQGFISEFGSIDPTSGGTSHRYSVSANWTRKGGSAAWDASVYAIDYGMDLWANFTYFVETDGDQHHQLDDRKIYGWDVARTQSSQWGALSVVNTVGSQLRYDSISEVGVLRSEARRDTSVYRTDAVDEWSAGIYWDNQLRWTNQLRTTMGVRYDYYDFRVTPLQAAFLPSLVLNGGNASDSIVTTSLGASYAFSEAVEAYVNAGQGFHSNDARGTTIQVDPVSGEAADQVDPLVDTRGFEFGLRTYLNDQLNASIALWSLAIDSELVFIGDSGSTEDTGVGSTRHGVELTAYYYLDATWTFDLEYAWSKARFDDELDGSRDIPGALEHVFSAGVNAQLSDELFFNIRLRHFDEYPLDGGLRADASTLANLRIGYRLNDSFDVSLDVLNLFDSTDRDIEYAYESRLKSELDAGLGPVLDRHFHVFEPRTAKLNVRYRF
ncbi:TonB-dependent receptor [Gammaproteobacteria bacterium LSUCC0112]|nr:TonB-dependent receptor [Gammaproteobacteria bacterium LSUCC0112]